MNDIQPWYKQFWPWFLITVPVITVIFCVTLIFIALDTEDSIVVDDYYKKGKAINLELSKIEAAKKLNISLEVTTREEQLNLKFASGKPATPVALMAQFYHPTLQGKDFTVNFIADAAGNYTAQLPIEMEGKWRITVTPFDRTWKVQQDVGLPINDAVTITP